MFKTTSIAAAVLGLALTAAPALAGSVSVSYRDLDLSTAEGKAKLQHRVDAAARAVCSARRPMTGSILPAPVDKECFETARAEVTQQVASAIDNAPQGSRLGG